MSDQCFMILGGGGMVGFQVADQICSHLTAKKIVIISLYRSEVDEAVNALEKRYPEVEIVGFWGDIFVRSAFNDPDQDAPIRRMELLKDTEHRAELYDDLFGEFQNSYERSQLVQLILEHKPDVIIDAINTATAISYQDLYTASKLVRRDLDAFLEAAAQTGGAEEARDRLVQSVETLLISQYVPQLVRHVVLINQAMRDAHVRLYLKVGTTGTGGMGLNIPYTHGEDKPSAKLMSKTSIAFAHTGLLFLLARTAGGPIVKEVKPAALIAWVDTAVRTIRRAGKDAHIYTSKPESLDEHLMLHLPEEEFTVQDVLRLVVADTGENGVFTRGEFEAITALRQMEFITPEEIARSVVLEIQGITTGKDVIPALDSAIMGPTYRAGTLRRQAIDELSYLEGETGIPSVAVGELGPPELSKMLWETYLLKRVFDRLDALIGQDAPALEGISNQLAAFLRAHPEVQDLITSTGVPILLPDGHTLLRGPFIRIPEISTTTEVPIKPGDIDRWAQKGWVDLRPANMLIWTKRFDKMYQARQTLHGRGSAAVDRQAYLYNQVMIGEVVGWVFNNEMGGYRIK